MIFRQQNVPPKQLLKEVQNEEFSLLGSRISLNMIERKTSDHITHLELGMMFLPIYTPRKLTNVPSKGAISKGHACFPTTLF